MTLKKAIVPTDQHLIEDFIPTEGISAEARREIPVRKEAISTLHLLWARRPLVAARAAVYSVLAPAPADEQGPKKAEAILPVGQAADFQAALRNHLLRLTQNWAEQVATIIGQAAGPQRRISR